MTAETATHGGSVNEMPMEPMRGHCLVTIGVVGCGKSTLQNALIHRLHTDERVQFHMQGGDVAEQQELRDWVYRFDRKELPPRTPVGLLQKFSIEFGQKKRLPRLNFMEISGEEIESILPTDDNPTPRFNERLEDILLDRNLNKLFVFVSDSSRYQDATGQTDVDTGKPRLYEDMLFNALLLHFKDVGLGKLNILFLAGKWDKVRHQNQDPEKFFKTNFPQTRSTIRYSSGNIKIQYIRFTIGRVHEDENWILSHDFTPIERVIQWIHQGCTRTPLKGYPRMRPTLWGKIKALVAT